jgi:hypothetical protein
LESRGLAAWLLDHEKRSYQKMSHAFAGQPAISTLSSPSPPPRLPGRAVRLAEAADALRAVLGVAPRPAERDRWQTRQAPAWRALGALGYAAAWTIGQGLTAPRAVAEALEGFDAPPA